MEEHFVARLKMHPCNSQDSRNSHRLSQIRLLHVLGQSCELDVKIFPIRSILALGQNLWVVG